MLIMLMSTLKIAKNLQKILPQLEFEPALPGRVSVRIWIGFFAHAQWIQHQ